ncbi:MAG: prepilin-type N-terminal cleavage/methylation domain-containing protein, partial [Hungatella sp.]
MIKTLETLRKRAKSNAGFSLIELIIVMAIMAVLTGVLAPQYIKYVEKSRVVADDTNAEEVKKAFEVIVAEGHATLGLKSGDKITITDAVAAVSTNKEIDTAMVEILPKYHEIKLKSNAYSTIEIIYTDTAALS